MKSSQDDPEGGITKGCLFELFVGVCVVVIGTIAVPNGLQAMQKVFYGLIVLAGFVIFIVFMSLVASMKGGNK